MRVVITGAAGRIGSDTRRGTFRRARTLPDRPHRSARKNLPSHRSYRLPGATDQHFRRLRGCHPFSSGRAQLSTLGIRIAR